MGYDVLCMKYFKFLIIICYLFIPELSQANNSWVKTDTYLADFYNRYSLHFDKYGLVYDVPGYGTTDFKLAESPRDHLSLATYYRYRAMAGDGQAKSIIIQAIRKSEQLLRQKTSDSHSFEDATAQFLSWRLLDQANLKLLPREKYQIKKNIIARVEYSLLAPDTENRAVLSATYWQFLVNEASRQLLINPSTKFKLDRIIKNKIDQALAETVDSSAWYREGTPLTFNPHYHLVTAFYTLAYGELSKQSDYLDLAYKMTANLRQLSFSNGMVEAQLGPRPVGLGAQFYLGAGLLNWHAGYRDYGAYLQFAQGDQFFSDPEFPNRLEYHSTVSDTPANYHDDYAFSNLAEVALVLPFFQNRFLRLSDSLQQNSSDNPIFNNGRTIIYNNTTYTLNPDNISTTVK